MQAGGKEKARIRWAKAFARTRQTPDRIAKTQEEIEKILPAKQEYNSNDVGITMLEPRLALVENRRKPNDVNISNKLSLRRSLTSTSSGSGWVTDDDDDKPTLKRRDDSNNN